MAYLNYISSALILVSMLQFPYFEIITAQIIIVRSYVVNESLINYKVPLIKGLQYKPALSYVSRSDGSF